MNGIVAALIIWMVGGIVALVLRRGARASAWTSAVSLAAGALFAVPSMISALAGNRAAELALPWGIPGAEFALRVDALSAWFLIPTLLIAIGASVYAVGYLSGEARHGSVGTVCFFFNALVAAIVLVLVARNAILFLTAWEVMALASFFLVTHDDERESVRRAGWIYLVATHIGTGFLLAFFLLLSRETASFDFGVWASPGALDPRSASLLFILALVGFGAKAGIIPFHVWLPEAHPAAPSHVSALMSGVMIKTGIYGLLRSLEFLDAPPLWWGWLLIGIGVLSGILGVLCALGQHDLKRLLAYHSVENIGIIVLGLGLGQLGISLKLPWLALLGLGGCLLHVLNHALFKGLLFLGAGSVLKATGSAEIDHLGGLARRMPWTGAAFLVGSAAISGLPPLNGFISEMLIFVGGFRAVAEGGSVAALAGLSVLAGLALISGLAIACFTKAYGIVFLGEPRSHHASDARENPATMRLPMATLAILCLAIGLGAPWLIGPALTAASAAAGLPAAAVQPSIDDVAVPLFGALVGSLLLIALCALLALLRRRLLSGREVTQAPTWDCGYARPVARMQYTASSFAQPITELFRPLLRVRTELESANTLFPGRSRFSSHTPDVWLERLYTPVFAGFAFLVSKLRWLQHGNIHLYVLYIALTLVALLIWMVGS